MSYKSSGAVPGKTGKTAVLLPGFSREKMEKNIPNECLDAYEVKVNIDIFKYQEKVKLISQFQRFLTFFNGL